MLLMAYHSMLNDRNSRIAHQWTGQQRLEPRKICTLGSRTQRFDMRSPTLYLLDPSLWAWMCLKHRTKERIKAISGFRTKGFLSPSSFVLCRPGRGPSLSTLRAAASPLTWFGLFCPFVSSFDFSIHAQAQAQRLCPFSAPPQPLLPRLGFARSS